MAEWRAELQNYHIKPGFPRTLGGANVATTDYEKRKRWEFFRSKCWSTTVSFEIMSYHLPCYIRPHPGRDVNYARNGEANFPILKPWPPRHTDTLQVVSVGMRCSKCANVGGTDAWRLETSTGGGPPFYPCSSTCPHNWSTNYCQPEQIFSMSPKMYASLHDFLADGWMRRGSKFKVQCYEKVAVAGLTPLPVGFPQKLQGSAMTRDQGSVWKHFCIQHAHHTQQTARRRVCSLSSQPPALLPFHTSSIGCWLTEQLTDYQPASSRGQIGDSCHSSMSPLNACCMQQSAFLNSKYTSTDLCSFGVWTWESRLWRTVFLRLEQQLTWWRHHISCSCSWVYSNYSL